MDEFPIAILYKVIELTQSTLDLFRLCMIHFAEFKFYKPIFFNLLIKDYESITTCIIYVNMSWPDVIF